jgi:hypothetical protein
VEFTASSRDSAKGVGGPHPRRKPEGLPQIRPALRVSGGIARSHDIGLAAFRVVRIAIPEIELIPSGQPLV